MFRVGYHEHEYCEGTEPTGMIYAMKAPLFEAAHSYCAFKWS